ncbi:MAG TPA: heterodisulfide reductase-related iron-sulfur binding cluster [Vicinamibacterales bacterium]|nr:heterodisulfide reductase-related iron-sulfur binding cluster [Vicinamibacterales bacterium]
MARQSAPGATATFDAIHPPASALIDTCVHCGFCLPTCPTYALWGEEMDSPRGRIYLMKAGLEGRAEMTPAFVGHFDSCLGCMACVTSCPSGVQYAPLIEATRAQIERRYPRALADRLFRGLLFALFPFPNRLRIALMPLAIWQAATRRNRGDRRDQRALRFPPDVPLPMARRRTSLSARMAAMLRLAPKVTLTSLFSSIPARTPAEGARRLTVGLLTGCVQRLVFPQVNAATVRVLSAEGCDVLAPPEQGCCGALALHAGRVDEARTFARRTMELFERAGVDQIAVNAAGCGSSMKEYGQLLADEPAWAGRARAFSARVRDVSEIVSELGVPRAPRHPLALRVAYHDACHLAHAQGVRQPPRDLLRSIPGIEILPFAEPEICCGSAGIYNLVEPDAARELGDRKAAHIDAVSPDLVATANPGCTLQMTAASARLGRIRPIRHPIEILDASIRGVDPLERG